MFRAFLVVALAAVAAAHGGHHPGPIYVRPNPLTPILGGLLNPSDYGVAIRLVQRRYSNLQSVAAAHILRYILRPQRLPIYGRIKYRTVPIISRRVAFLRSYFGALPGVFYHPTYYGGLRSYLSRYHFKYNPSSLLAPLAFCDIRLASHLYRPVSVSSFNGFFGRHILGFNGKVFRGFPSLGRLDTILGGISLSAYPRIFQSIVSVSVSYPGSSLLPIWSGIGLPALSQPQATLGGLYSYLASANIRTVDFIRHCRTIRLPNINRLIHSLLKLYSGVYRTDLLPLLALRYYSFPTGVRRNLNFVRSTRGFLRSIKIPGRLSSRYVRGFLGRYSKYIRHHYLKKYSGKLWW
nr:CP52k-like protein 2 [Capitulum mitella]